MIAELAEKKSDPPPAWLICESPAYFAIDFGNFKAIYSSDQDAQSLAASLLFLFKQFRIEGKYPSKIDLRFEKPVIKY